MSDQPLTIDEPEPELPVAAPEFPASASGGEIAFQPPPVPAPWEPDEVEAYRSYDPAGASLQELGDIGRVFAKSGFFKDARDAAQCITKILAGRELGLGPFQAMSGFHVVEGKPTMSAGLVGALVKRSERYDFLPKTSTDNECVIDWYQRNELVGQSSFSMEDARRAKLIRVGGGWEKYPKAMLFNRALTAGARMYCPDVFGGAIYTPDELGA